MEKATPSAVVSVSPPSSRRRPVSGTWNSGARSPGAAAASTARQTLGSPGVPAWARRSTQGRALSPSAVKGAAQEIPDASAGVGGSVSGCRYRGERDAMRAVVTADYSGEIKVFVGFVKGLDRVGL